VIGQRSNSKSARQGWISSLVKTVAVDFDGVIAFYDGWRGGYHIGEPNPEGAALLWLFQEAGIRVIIYTCRTNRSKPQEYDYDKVEELIKEWMKKHNLPYDYLCVQMDGKPYADVYVDDKTAYFAPNIGPAKAVFEEVVRIINSHPDRGTTGTDMPRAGERP